MDHSATMFLMDSKGEFYGTSNFQEPEETRRAKLRQLDQERVSALLLIRRSVPGRLDQELEPRRSQ